MNLHLPRSIIDCFYGYTIVLALLVGSYVGIYGYFSPLTDILTIPIPNIPVYKLDLMYAFYNALTEYVFLGGVFSYILMMYVGVGFAKKNLAHKNEIYNYIDPISFKPY